MKFRVNDIKNNFVADIWAKDVQTAMYRFKNMRGTEWGPDLGVKCKFLWGNVHMGDFTLLEDLSTIEVVYFSNRTEYQES